MTGMEYAIEKAAKVLAAHQLSEPQGGTNARAWCECSCGSRLETVGGTRDHAVTLGNRHIARALADAGLLAPAPLREGGVGWYEVIHPSRATTHIAYVHEDGSIYFPEGDYPLSEREFAFAAATGRAHRLVRAARDPLVMNIRGHSAPPPPHGLNPHRRADQ